MTIAKQRAMMALVVGAALSLASCSDDSSTNIGVQVLSFTVGLTSDPANERVEGTLSLALNAPEGFDDVEIESFDIALTNPGAGPLDNATVETDTVFPIRMKAGTSARAHFRLSADSTLPPPPDLSGWCGGSMNVAVEGSLGLAGNSTPFAGPSAFLERSAPFRAPEVGVSWVTKIPSDHEIGSPVLAIDAAGNTLVGAGSFDSVSGNFFPPVLTKLDDAGHPLWTRDLGAQGWFFTVTHVAAGADIDIAAGFFNGTIDLGDGPLDSAGTNAAYVARLDAKGEVLWSRPIQSVSGEEFGIMSGITLIAVEVDASDNVLIVGSSEGTAVVIGNETIEPEPGASSYWPFSFMVTFSPSGDYISGKRLGAHVTAVTMDPAGAMLLAGPFEGTVNLGGDPLTVGDQGVWLAKLDATGEHLWSRAYPANADFLRVTGIEAGPGGEIHIMTRTFDTIDFGAGFQDGPNTGIFLSKLDAQGGHLWSKPYAKINAEAAPAMAVDDAGRVFLVGDNFGSIDFGAGLLPNDGDFPVLFAAQLDASGAQLQAALFGCAAFTPSALAFRSGVSSSVTFAAPFNRAAALGNQTFSSVTGQDVIVGAFAP